MGDLNATEWPGEYSELKEIDALLRCPICYEYVETAMMIPNCSHNYCSLCIRRYIQYKNKCPQCSITATEPELKNNRTVDEILKLYSSVRSKLLTLMLNHKSVGRNIADIGQSSSNLAKSVLKNNVSPKAHESEVKSPQERKTERVKRKTNKKRKISVTSSDSEVDSDVMFCDSPATPKQNGINSDEDFLPDIEKKSPPAAFTNVKDVHTSSKVHDKRLDIPAKVTASGSEKNSIHNLLSPKATTKTSPFFMSASNSPIPGTSSLPKDKDQKSAQGKSPQIVRVSCPVCSVDVPERNINLHLDRCLNGPPKREQEKARRKRMPNLVYALMKDAELKKKLSELGLSNAGDRKTLIKRHHEFTLLYNVECDSLNPKPVKEIIKDLEKAEKNRNKPINNSLLKGKLTIEKGASSNDVDKAQKEYVTEHKQQFKDLIAKAKASMKRKKEAEKGKEIGAKSQGAASYDVKAIENSVLEDNHGEISDTKDSENHKNSENSNRNKIIPDVNCIQEESNNRIINTNLQNDSASKIPCTEGVDSLPSIPGYSPDVSTNSQRSDSTQESKSLIQTADTHTSIENETHESTINDTEEIAESVDSTMQDTIENEGSVDKLEELIPSSSKCTSSQESTDLESLSSMVNSDDETSDFIPDSPVETNPKIVRRSLRQKSEKKEPVKRESLKRKTKHSHSKNEEIDLGHTLRQQEVDEDFKDEDQNHRLNRKTKRKRQK